jgi:N-acetylglutamate synthase-like GNAT family acetyltransferase
LNGAWDRQRRVEDNAPYPPLVSTHRISHLNSARPVLPFVTMTASNYRVRRATLDDLPALKELWAGMHLAADDLERRLTEFQVIEGADGQFVGALGVQISRPHAWLHSEAYRDFSVADQVRPALFERIQSLASNHGVFRLWTQDQSPFWTLQGFQPADADALKKLPPAWSNHGPNWFTLQLKNEEAIISVEKELAMFMAAEKARTARAMGQARALKVIATFVALVFAMLLFGAALYLWKKNSAGLIPH